ncbi:hypothetical protein C8R44DRAFT_789886 [Mycena epipterygia]|nr:hypothetical protein C8R44DRAFT_789886 [Mycena epipterygia]
MKPFHAILCLVAFTAFLFGCLATRRLVYPENAPFAPAIGWILFELKAALAVFCFFLAIFFAIAFVYHNLMSHKGAVALTESEVPTPPATRPLPFGPSVLLFAQVFNAGMVSFALFRSGVAWPQPGLFLDNAAAFALYFLRGLFTSAVVFVLFSAVYRGAKYALAAVCGRREISDAENSENSEKEGLEI